MKHDTLWSMQETITTVGGLIVAILYYIIYGLYIARIHAAAEDINNYGEELLSIMKIVDSKKRK